MKTFTVDQKSPNLFGLPSAIQEKKEKPSLSACLEIYILSFQETCPQLYLWLQPPTPQSSSVPQRAVYPLWEKVLQSFIFTLLDSGNLIYYKTIVVFNILRNQVY